MSTLSTATPFPPPQPPLMTGEEFTQRYGNLRAELVEGILTELPMPNLQHGAICSIVNYILCKHVFEADLGHVMSNDSWVKTRGNPDTVLGPDVCFFSYERLPRGNAPTGLVSVMPELVIEVRSPSDRWTKIVAKALEYLQAGARVVVILDPASTTVSVFRDEEVQQTLHQQDELTLPDVLPGFSVPVSRLFSR